MIMGECPNCDAVVTNYLPGEDIQLPVFEKTECESCGNPYWIKLSRLDPVAYTEEDFFKDYEIDENSKIVKPRKNHATL